MAADLVSKLLGKEQDFELETLVAILENDPQGVVIIDEEAKVVFVNKFFLSMFAYGWMSKLTDGTVEVHQFVAERMREFHPEWIKEWFQDPRHMKLESRGHNDIYGERKLGSKQREEHGAEIHLEIEIAPFQRSDGKRLAIAYIREKK